MLSHLILLRPFFRFRACTKLALTLHIAPLFFNSSHVLLQSSIMSQIYKINHTSLDGDMLYTPSTLSPSKSQSRRPSQQNIVASCETSISRLFRGCAMHDWFLKTTNDITSSSHIALTGYHKCKLSTVDLMTSTRMLMMIAFFLSIIP